MYVTMTHNEASKNHPGGLSDVPTTKTSARMYETNSDNDGYKAMELYHSKLSDCEAFFQYPRRNWNPNDMPAARSKQVRQHDERTELLSKLYTNHSVRATAITLWSNAGIPNRRIMAISGYRNEQSLVNYINRPVQLQRRSLKENGRSRS